MIRGFFSSTVDKSEADGEALNGQGSNRLSLRNTEISEVPLRRKISLLLIVAFAAALAITGGCSRSDGVDAGDQDDSVSFDVNDPRIKERLGEDDGYAFAVMYGADIHGSLETCG